MKFLLEYPRWSRVKKQLKQEGLVKLPKSTGRLSGDELHNYSLPLEPPKYYPRLHIITSGNGQDNGYHLRLIEIHVDITPHKHTEHIHPAIDRVANIIKFMK